MHPAPTPESPFFDDGPLVPPPDEWPVFGSVVVYSFATPSPSPPAGHDTLPSATELAAMPVPPSRSSPRNKNPDHIPRPRNAFMLFRSAFAAAQKISSNIEHDNRHITRIIAHCWHRLSNAEKQVWRDKATTEKAQHAQLYPNYRFSPVGRVNRRAKRNVRRNGAEDVKRCEKLAELVMAGKIGHELENAIKEIDNERLAAAHVVDDSLDLPTDAGPTDVPPFRSPLLPPAAIASQHDATPEVSDAIHVVISQSDDVQPLVGAATACRAESPTFYTPAMLNSAMESLLLESPCHPRNDVPCPGSILPVDVFPPFVADFAQDSGAVLEQSVVDVSLCSWIPSDGFPYYN